MMNFYQWNPLMPKIPTNNTEPPTVFSILQSIVNFGKIDKTKVTNLAKEGHSRIFNFEYPLTNKVSKEKFECMILNHFLMRRINFETVLLFQMQLENKLNEIMPFYNKLFESIDGWNIFEDEIHDLTSDTTTTDSTNSTNNISSSNDDDIRNSNMPQSQIDNVKEGKYLTNYTYSQSNSNSDSNSNSTSNGTNQNILHETRNRTPSEKLEVYKAFQDDIKNVYTLLFKDLECLFYQIIP